VYGIIKGHKGDIAVGSEVGEGTTFTITFPVVQKEVCEAPVCYSNGTDTTNLRGLKVLVVEDEEAIRRMMQRFLSGKDVKVTCVESGKAAIDTFSKEQFDLVFLDIMMPGMNGLECLGHLRTINASVPIVIITGNLEKNLREKVVSLGAADCIQKPFDFDQIADALGKVMDRRSLHLNGA
jgi:CheY-like chemotaxis protein